MPRSLRCPAQFSEARHNSAGDAQARQMSRAYSAMVRSLENLPQRATLRMDMRVQRSMSR